ncbi:MAG: TAXI family TRAP transporter solute-binding subunit [Chloroflexota bacterium]
MRKLVVILVALAIVMSLVIACAQPAPSPAPSPKPTVTPTPTPAASPSPKPSPTASPAAKPAGWPERLRVGSSEAGHPTYIPAVAISDMIGKYVKLEARAAVYGSIGALGGELNKKNIELGVSASTNVWEAFTGAGGKTPLREGLIFTTGEEIPLLVIARKGSGIKTIADIKGKRWSAKMPGSSTNEAARKAMEKVFGLTEKDFTLMTRTGPETLTAEFREGKVDVANYFTSPSTPWITDLSASGAIYFVPFSDAEIAKLIEAEPQFVPAIMPAGSYPNQKEVLKSFGMLRVIVAHKNLPEDLVYAITAAIYDHFKEFEGYGAALAFFKLPEAIAVDKLQVPVHPGAVKYYKEKGFWTPQHQEKQEKLLKQFGS